jgi:hypothetical protein
MHALKPTDARSQALGHAQSRPSDQPFIRLTPDPTRHCRPAPAPQALPPSLSQARQRPARPHPPPRARALPPPCLPPDAAGRTRMSSSSTEYAAAPASAAARGSGAWQRTCSVAPASAATRCAAASWPATARAMPSSACARAPTRASWHGRQLGWISLICSVEQPVSQIQYVLLRMPSRACARPRPETGPIALQTPRHHGVAALLDCHALVCSVKATKVMLPRALLSAPVCRPEPGPALAGALRGCRAHRAPGGLRGQADKVRVQQRGRPGDDVRERRQRHERPRRGRRRGRCRMRALCAAGQGRVTDC